MNMKKNLKKIKTFLEILMFKIFPSKFVVSIFFMIKHKYKLNFSNPKTFNEIINVRKFNNDYEELYPYTDKSLAKETAKRIDENIEVFPTLGVFNYLDESILSKLPNEFVVKSTHNSQSIDVVRDKMSLNKKEVKSIIKKQNNALKHNLFDQTHEPQYKNIKPRVIVEELMLDENGNVPVDYKIMCIHGEPVFIECDLERFSNFHLVFMSPDWKLMPWRLGKHSFPVAEDEIPEKPNNLDEMLRHARKLSKGFDFVRIDLYSFNNKVYFGEFTFLHDCGFSKFSEYKYDLYYGNLINGVNGVKES